MKIYNHASLKSLNTLHVDVSADYLVKAYSEKDIIECVNFSREINLPIIILGDGSNIVLRQNLHAIVLQIESNKIELISQKNNSAYILAQAGCLWHDLVVYTLEHQWFGLENLSLIPGRVGAAPIQNIGAYGVELCDVLEEVHAISISDLKKYIFKKSDCEFGYRDSIFKGKAKDQYIITAIVLKLSTYFIPNLSYAGIAEYLKAHNLDLTATSISASVCALRKNKLPDPKILGNAGSFFKNPIVKVDLFDDLKNRYPDIVHFDAGGKFKKLSAAWLIDKAGWKGKDNFGAAVHEKQPLVLINKSGSASGEEILKLAYEIQADIYQKYKVNLEIEPRIY